MIQNIVKKFMRGMVKLFWHIKYSEIKSEGALAPITCNSLLSILHCSNVSNYSYKKISNCPVTKTRLSM